MTYAMTPVQQQHPVSGLGATGSTSIPWGWMLFGAAVGAVAMHFYHQPAHYRIAKGAAVGAAKKAHGAAKKAHGAAKKALEESKREKWYVAAYENRGSKEHPMWSIKEGTIAYSQAEADEEARKYREEFHYTGDSARVKITKTQPKGW